jgi:hypothetical protein
MGQFFEWIGKWFTFFGHKKTAKLLKKLWRFLESGAM